MMMMPAEEREMMTTTTSLANGNGQALIVFPLGFRFQPTDEELLVQYLRRKNLNLPLPSNLIMEIDLYKYHPSEIGQSGGEENKCYFFTKTEPKHPNGVRPNRVAKNGGNWKATTKDKPVKDYKNNEVGTKRSLVFVESDKKKTKWLMQEYKTAKHKEKNEGDSSKSNEWTVCCIYEHINAEEKKKRKDMEVASSSQVIMANTSSFQLNTADANSSLVNLAITIQPNMANDGSTQVNMASTEDPASRHAHAQSPPRKRQKGDVVSKDEGTSHAGNITEWKREEDQSLYDGLPNLDDLDLPFDIDEFDWDFEGFFTD